MVELHLVVCYARCLDNLEALVLLPDGFYLMVEVGPLLHKPRYLLLSVYLYLRELIAHYTHLLSDLSLLCLEFINLERKDNYNKC